nr:YIP1 family protein [candidate division Zixibacteria bacterium]
MEMENNNLPSGPELPAEPKSGKPAAIFKVFSEPSGVFGTLTGKLDWLIPLIVIAVISCALWPLTAPITTRDMQKKTVANLEKYRDRLPADQYDKIVSDVKKRFEEGASFKWYTPLIFLLWPFISMLIISVIGYISGNFVFGGRSSFWIVMNAVAFAALIGFLGDIVRGLLMYWKDTMFVYTGLGLLKPAEDGSFLHYLLRQVDIFGIWRIIVTCIGLGVVYKMKPSKFGFVLFPIWIVFILLVAILNSTIMMGNLIY